MIQVSAHCTLLSVVMTTCTRNFRIFRIEEHLTKIKTYENFLAQYCQYVLRHYAELYEYLYKIGSSYKNLHQRKLPAIRYYMHAGNGAEQ